MTAAQTRGAATWPGRPGPTAGWAVTAAALAVALSDAVRRMLLATRRPRLRTASVTTTCIRSKLAPPQREAAPGPACLRPPLAKSPAQIAVIRRDSASRRLGGESARAYRDHWSLRCRLVMSVAVSSRSGSCREMASRPTGRGCRLPKRAEVRMLGCAARRSAEASTLVVPAGRCTTPPNLPRGRGWGERIRRGVATGVARTPMLGSISVAATTVLMASVRPASGAESTTKWL
jgi:hypothetical protein